MKQAGRKAVCGGIGCRGGKEGVRSLESGHRLDPPSVGLWVASCPFWVKGLEERSNEPNGNSCSPEEEGKAVRG